MSKKTSRKVLLKRAELIPASKAESPDIARVVLFVNNRLAIGQVSIPPIENGIIEATSLATIQALTKSLPEGTRLVLQKTLKMQPEYLDDALIVAIVDAKYDDLELNLTGASIVREEKIVWGAANAVLDATNRLTSFLLEIEDQDDSLPDEE
ncbi:MAG: hypothetical protein HY819_02195 [Acidobacteria bacterium]|nr:hypothetical protein [Acidobacteriota bacterium]